MTIPSDADIARAAAIRPITEIAAKLGIDDAQLIPYGHSKAKIDLARLDLALDTAGETVDLRRRIHLLDAPGRGQAALTKNDNRGSG